ncbi:tyrosine-type recombinase/integrase [Aquabacterium sp. A7-Y]|uniref:tyrosine-type recombinase/integrase n=1 Tax=Aquabacterium sp. A7-Y TaxID=1349605 RepID=UPI0039FCC247
MVPWPSIQSQPLVALPEAAGLRIGEQLALRWQSVDMRSYAVVVREARVMGRDKDRTKTAFERIVELNVRAAAVLHRQRARTQSQKHGRVFATAGQPDKPWHDEQLQWRAWNSCLRRCGVRYRAPKECPEPASPWRCRPAPTPCGWPTSMGTASK